MITLAFLAAQRKVIKFEIVGKRVVYYDNNWKKGIQIYPMDKKLVRRLLKSSDKQISATGLLIADANHGKNLKEYEACETEDELAVMIKADCQKKGLMEIK